MYTPPAKRETQTQYHGAAFFNERLHKIMAYIDDITSLRTDDAGSLANCAMENYNLVHSFFKELSPKMDKERRAEHIEACEIIKEEMEKKLVIFRKTGALNSKILKELDLWEIELRAFAETKGLISPEKTDESAILDV